MLGVVTEERIRIRYGETDMMGHAYYANYLLWFEQARGGWCRDRGYSYLDLEHMGFKLPVMEAHLRYKGEVRYDDLIVVRIKLTQLKLSALRFEYEVFNETTGKTCTTGYTWHMLVSPKMRPTKIPPEVMELLLRDPSAFPTLG